MSSVDASGIRYSDLVDAIKQNKTAALDQLLQNLIMFADAASLELIFSHVFMDKEITIDQKKDLIAMAKRNGAEIWSFILPSYILERSGECPKIIEFILSVYTNAEREMLSSPSHLQLAIQQALLLERYELVKWLTKIVKGKGISKNMSEMTLQDTFDINNVIQEDPKLLSSFGNVASDLVSSLVTT